MDYIAAYEHAKDWLMIHTSGQDKAMQHGAPGLNRGNAGEWQPVARSKSRAKTRP